MSIVVVVIAAVATGAFLLLGNHGMRSRGPSPSTIVVLDAGHGGRDPGAVYGDVHEADLNLAVMKQVAEFLDTDPRIGVHMTRTLDISVSLEDRIGLANDSDAALYLSIQSNASTVSDASGIETLVSDQVAQDAAAWQWAEILQDAVTNATGARDRGVRSQDLYLHRAEMPAALIEIGFLSNRAEREKLLDPTYQNTIAKAIYNGIVTYLTFSSPNEFADKF